MLNATRPEADIRIDEELDLYCESFGLRANWDILLSGFLCFNFFYLTNTPSRAY